ncbi:MAG: DNA polymerase I [Myxococcota bacterium]
MASQATPVALPDVHDPGALWILDISGYVFRAYHKLPPLSNSLGEPTHAVLGAATMILKLIREYQPALLAVAADSPGRSARKERFAEYKANRPPAPPDLSAQLSRIQDVVRAYEIPIYQEEGFEADDLIASLVRHARQEGLRVVIVSADKDLLQLVGDDVVMFDTDRSKVYGPEETRQKLGVPPHQVRDLLALMGDTSDNVPGVPKVGQKTAAKLLQQFEDIDGVYSSLDQIPQKALNQTLRQHREQALMSRDLVTLRDELSIDFDRERLRWTGGDTKRVRALFAELEFSRLVRQIEIESPSASHDTSAEAQAGRTETAYQLLTSEQAVADLVSRAFESRAIALVPVYGESKASRSHIIGLGLSVQPFEGCYVPLGHRYIGAPAQLEPSAIASLLRPVFEDPQIVRYTDGFKRDLPVWRDLGLPVGSTGSAGDSFLSKNLDVMLLSYLLDPERHRSQLADVVRTELGEELAPHPAHGKKKTPLDMLEIAVVGEFAARQADCVFRLGSLLSERLASAGLAPLYEEMELPLAEVLAEMEETGIRVDVALLSELSEEVTAELARLEAKCFELAGRSFLVSSPRQLEAVLFDELELPVLKRTKTARSTDHDVLEELAGVHELPKAILEYRGLAKLKSTYLDALPAQVAEGTGRIHTRYEQSVARTGRLSSVEPNLQNIPIRSERGRRVREAFIPQDGWIMLAADYSQIELRILAHLSQDEALVEAYRTGLDVHRRTASALFGVDESAVDRHMRNQAKTVNFAVIYGQTQFALARNLGISRNEAKRYIDAFFERYQGVRTLMQRVIEEGREQGCVTTLMGRRRPLPDLRSRNHHLRAAAERIARNTPIQGTAADIMKVAMVRVHRRLRAENLSCRMLLTVHDELVFELPKQEQKQVEYSVRQEMEQAIELSVPLVVELGAGSNWGDAH